MQIAERSAGNVKVLDLSGPDHLHPGRSAVQDKIHSLVHQGHKNILVNMADVTHVDSAGLGELVSAYTTVTKAGGSMKLVNLTRRLTDLLSIEAATVFDTFENEQDTDELQLIPGFLHHTEGQTQSDRRAARRSPQTSSLVSRILSSRTSRCLSRFCSMRQQPLLAELFTCLVCRFRHTVTEDERVSLLELKGFLFVGRVRK